MPLFTHGHALLIGVGGDLPNTATDAAGVAEILTAPRRCASLRAQWRLSVSGNPRITSDESEKTQ